MIHAVIMAGGKGERFWPKSRRMMPKQLLSLTDDGKTMIQLTVDRLKKLCSKENTYVVTNNDYCAKIKEQLPQIEKENIIVEPFGKNTAPCIGLAAMNIAKNDPEGVMIVLPSDHLIKNNILFLNTLKSAIELAEKGDNIVTIGITPSYAETGYGYINFEEETEKLDSCNFFKVKRFVEKPDRKKAEEYLVSGNYLWNSGMFVWKVSTILKNFKMHMPELYSGLVKISETMNSDINKTVIYDEYEKFESISIDYGIMEKAKNIYTIPGNFGWDDVGSWTSLERVQVSDELGNIKKGNVIDIDTQGCIIQGKDKLIATVGVENIVVVDTDDATLICAKDKCQDIKALLNKMKELKMEEYL
ncbi:mannose-1-phosphate guanylyltransferase [Clostridium magnum]|uniref:mannose-1-phosphate guanylyltransferase n=1 Tax=Clostridium magnum DSM 2767 TaxID=1121326 RepID=A0A162RP39_9CLOT|nr:mannose-1-phosphate guanylyltransferase [Clostridium magnum]KZL90189.1 alginate biosynthesis protein AlgA [Clostridium magnum DSM 2767]SHH63850.1 mannose-1-phosphate guanylyltransferase [Clostridium magnum DSM 2767]